MDGLLLGPLVLFGAAMCFTPGPNVVMITASAANFGFRRAVPHMLGITIGFGFLVMATGLGLAGLLEAEPRLDGSNEPLVPYILKLAHYPSMIVDQFRPMF